MYQKSGSDWIKYVKAKFRELYHQDIRREVKRLTKEEKEARLDRRKLLIAKHQSRFAREVEVNLENGGMDGYFQDLDEIQEEYNEEIDFDDEIESIESEADRLLQSDFIDLIYKDDS